MAKGPDLASAAENPDHAQHVANVSNMIKSATPEQRTAGIGWYRNAAQDAAHIASGIHPGQMVPHATQGDVGVTSDKPGTSNLGSQFTRNELADNHARQMGHARSLGQGEAESYARSGRYHGQQSSAVNDAGRPFGATSHAPAVKRAATGIAAMSPAGPTGMTWDNNPRAVADSKHLNGQQFDAIAHANTIKPGTPERADASALARTPFKGTALNHQTTGNVEKGMRAMRGDYDDVQHPLGQQKTQHFANDIYNEVSPGHEENRTGMTGTVDKHQEDVIAGVTKPWSVAKANGNADRGAGARLAGEHGLPKLSSDKGYAYQRDVVHEASGQNGLRPKEGQAVSWVAQKASKDNAAREARAAAKAAKTAG
jgi:hypothetical protein